MKTETIHVRMNDENVTGSMFGIEDVTNEDNKVMLGYAYDEDTAELWASAPELLEALDNVLNVLDNFITNERGHIQQSTYKTFDSAVDVVKKARGE